MPLFSSGPGVELDYCQPGTAIEHRSAAWWTSASRLLAGLDLPDASPMVSIGDRRSVVAHREQLSALWANFDTKRLQPIRDFAGREMAAVPGTAPVFYPFSGPDAAYAPAFFPASSEFIFTGLEPVGEVPDLRALDEAALATSLDRLRNSLRSVLALSFFVTLEMDSDLRRNQLSGVTPILMLFLARHGYNVNAVEPFVMEADGSLCHARAMRVKDIRSSDLRIPGVVVRFQRPGDPLERRIIYLKADLSNVGLQKRPQYLRFVDSINPQTTLIKSASYLLHLKEFTTLRDHILKHSQAILQDDTGVPLKLYKAAQWEHRLYGAYVGPIPIFRTRFQPEMLTAYRGTAHPLGFGIGYRYESHESNLQLFVRRTNKVVATAGRPASMN
ncbi:MAG: hypothetical protein ACKVQU_34775 [Burkholderiales bacterium]